MKKLSILAFLFFSILSSSQEITVAAAADLQFAFQDIAARFEKQTGHPVKLTFGSSGNFFAQIQNGAPFDVYFSADIDYPKRLQAAGLTEPGTLYEYATGKIVLWVPSGSKVDVNKGLHALLDSNVNKIAIANPEHAPYGRAAVAAMKHENIYDKVSEQTGDGREHFSNCFSNNFRWSGCGNYCSFAGRRSYYENQRTIRGGAHRRISCNRAGRRHFESLRKAKKSPGSLWTYIKTPGNPSNFARLWIYCARSGGK